MTMQVLHNQQTSLTREQKQAVGLLSIGTFLEYFDLMLYVHMAILLNSLFFPETDAFTGSLLTAFAFCSTYIMRPFGALLFGYIGDNIGRRHTVIITTFLMAFSCFVMALLPTYEDIGITASIIVTLCRMLQGLSSMGEFVGSQLYLTEITKPPIQYPIVTLTSVFAIFGGVVALAVASLSTLHGLNWRYAFWFGVCVALIGSAARRTLKETPDFADAKKRVQKVLNQSQSDKVQNNIFIQDTHSMKKDKKTFLYLFGMDCAWPICFYFAYVFCGDLLKKQFGFTSVQVIHQNFLVGIVQLISIIVICFLSARISATKIVKVKLLIFITTVAALPILMKIIPNHYTIFLLQCLFIVFACDYVPARPIPYKHISVFRRFTYNAFSYALSRAVMYIITSFGLIYLVEYLGYIGMLIILIPTIVTYTMGIMYFDKLELEAQVLAHR